MSNFKKREVHKTAEKLEKEMLNSPSSIWNSDSEEEQKTTEEIKKKWRRKQINKFNQLQHQKWEKKQITKFVIGLFFVTSFVIVVPFVPIAWQLANNLILGSSSESEETANSEKKKVGENIDIESKEKIPSNSVTEKNSLEKFFNNLKKVQEKQEEHNRELQKAIDMSDGKSISPLEK